MEGKQLIAARFIQVVDALISNGEVASYKAFTQSYGYSKALISHIREGRQSVPLELIYLLAKQQGVNPSFIFGISQQMFMDSAVQE